MIYFSQQATAESIEQPSMKSFPCRREMDETEPSVIKPSSDKSVIRSCVADRLGGGVLHLSPALWGGNLIKDD